MLRRSPPRPVRPLAAPVTALVATAAVVLAGCGDDAGDDTGADGASDIPPATGPTTGDGTDAPGAEAPPPLADVEIRATEVATADEPTALEALPGSSTLLVAERPGRVRALTVSGDGDERRYELVDDPVLDIADEVATGGTEQGLLDIEPTPDGSTLYVSYSVAPSGDTRVDAYPLRIGDGDPPAVDAGGRREVLAVGQLAPNHNGGQVTVGPDGMLYVGLGDGGGAGDPGDNGQDPSTLLGSILRIDPESPGGPGGTDAYGIPDGNPFAPGGPRSGEGRPEVWLYGVRNPWRFTFDPETDDLWVADVGQNAWEEVNLLPARDGGAGRGDNLGWPEMEGTHSFEGGSNPEGAVLPIFEYGREGGCSITGGVVYRGEAIDGLRGAYLFADYCAGELRALRADDGGLTDEHTFDVSLGNPASFGTDGDGEVYALSLGGPILRLDP
ncbi:MAG TPA: PQQ-dependent sugar dehydrogenase [Acidimicrobiales bacterium]